MATVAPALRVPNGVILAKDETVQAYGEFLVSNLFVWVKLKLALTNKRLAGEKPNTLLGIIPVGSDKVSYPLGNIAGVHTTTRVSVLPLLLGLILFVAGIASVQQGGWIWIVIGALLILSSYQARLDIQNSGGDKIHHRISIFNKGAAQTFAQEINTVIAGRS